MQTAGAGKPGRRAIAMSARKLRLSAEQRRALWLLAGSSHGCTEATLLAHGFTTRPLPAGHLVGAPRGGERWGGGASGQGTPMCTRCAKRSHSPKRTIAAAGLFLVMQQLTVRED
jgi:hypothetical protein